MHGPFEPGWSALLERRDAHWSHLTSPERERMEHLVGAFVHRTRWEAARGFHVDAEMQVLIAAQACLLLLGLDHDEFGGPSRVIVHPRTVTLRGRRSLGIGRVEASGPHWVVGQAHHGRGPVLLSWATVASEVGRPERGRNVVYHEFAHRLDMLDGTVDGTPPLRDAAARQRWIEVCTAAYQQVRDPEPVVGADGGPDGGPVWGTPVARRGPPVLRAYAGTNPGEFFAVATEAFLTRPHELGDQHPALYRELVDYYGQNPARRLPPPAPHDQEHP